MSTASTQQLISVSQITAGLNEILSLGLRGWLMFPCIERDKTPLISGWPQRASCDAAIIREWSEKYLRCNWAVVCGLSSGLWVLDIDGPSGEASFNSLIDRYGSRWAETLTARTARGRHLYYQYPSQGGVRNSASTIAPGLDVRGAGGYVLVPPSIHPSGVAYEWADREYPIAAPPAWLLDRVAAPSKARPTRSGEIGILPEGCRNDGLTRLAGSLRRHGATESEMESSLLGHNTRRCRPPLPTEEVRKIVASVMRYSPGGPDPLQAAWQATEGKSYRSRYEHFVELARQLQLVRPGQSIALPLVRISQLIGCDWTMVGRYRKQAVKAGLLVQTEPYVPHRRAAQYRFSLPSSAVGPTRDKVPLSVPTSGLVGQARKAPSGTSALTGSEATRQIREQPWESKCRTHGIHSEWWYRPDGDAVCNRCHPNPDQCRSWPATQQGYSAPVASPQESG